MLMQQQEIKDKENNKLTKSVLNISPGTKQPVKPIIHKVEASYILVCSKFQESLHIDFGRVAVKSTKQIQFTLRNPSKQKSVKVSVDRLSEKSGINVILDSIETKSVAIDPERSKVGVIYWSPTNDSTIRSVVHLKMDDRAPLQIVVNGIAGSGIDNNISEPSEPLKGKGPPKKKAPVSTTTSTTLSSCLSPERKTVSKASGNKVTFASPDRGIKTQQVRSPLLPTKAATGATVPAKSPTHPMGHSKPMTKKAFSIALGGNNWAEKQAANFKDWMNYTFQKAAQDSLSVCTHEAGDNPHIDDTRGKDTSELAAKNSDSMPEAQRYASSFKQILQKRVDSLARQRGQDLFRDAGFQSTLTCLKNEVESGRLAIREDRDIHADLGQQELFFDLIFSYELPWLKLGLETVTGQVISVNMHSKDGKTQSNSVTSSNRVRLAFKSFVLETIFSDRSILDHFGRHKLLYIAQEKKLKEALRRHMLCATLTLVLFLDAAKTKTLLPKSTLFLKDSGIRSSKDVLTNLCRCLLKGEGDIVRHLQLIGYTLTYSQTFVDEYDYPVKNLALDLRDGVRLVKVYELLTGSKVLTDQLRVPAVSRLQKLHNVSLILNTLYKGADVRPNPKQIVDGQRDVTLALLWRLLYEFELRMLIQPDRVVEEVQTIRRSRSWRRSIYSRSEAEQFSVRVLLYDDVDLTQQGDEKSNQVRAIMKTHTMDESCPEDTQDDANLTSEKEDIKLSAALMRWVRAICEQYQVPVFDFTTCLADGRALCLLVHYYHPAILPTRSIRKTTAHLIQEQLRKQQHDLTQGCPGSNKKSPRKRIDSNLTLATCPLNVPSADLMRALSGERKNFSILKRACQHLGGIPLMLPEDSSYDSRNLPEEKTMVLFLGFLFSRLTESAGQVSAAILIQKRFRAYLARKNRRSAVRAAHSQPVEATENESVKDVGISPEIAANEGELQELGPNEHDNDEDEDNDPIEYHEPEEDEAAAPYEEEDEEVVLAEEEGGLIILETEEVSAEEEEEEPVTLQVAEEELYKIHGDGDDDHDHDDDEEEDCMDEAEFFDAFSSEASAQSDCKGIAVRVEQAQATIQRALRAYIARRRVSAVDPRVLVEMAVVGSPAPSTASSSIGQLGSLLSSSSAGSGSGARLPHFMSSSSASQLSSPLDLVDYFVDSHSASYSQSSDDKSPYDLVPMTTASRSFYIRDGNRNLPGQDNGDNDTDTDTDTDPDSRLRLSLLLNLNCEGEATEKEEGEEEGEQFPEEEFPMTCVDEAMDGHVEAAAPDDDRLSLAQIYHFRDSFEFSASAEELLGLTPGSSSSDNFTMDYRSSSPTLTGLRRSSFDEESFEDRVPLVCKEGLSEEEIVWMRRMADEVRLREELEVRLFRETTARRTAELKAKQAQENNLTLTTLLEESLRSGVEHGSNPVAVNNDDIIPQQSDDDIAEVRVRGLVRLQAVVRGRRQRSAQTLKKLKEEQEQKIRDAQQFQLELEQQELEKVRAAQLQLELEQQELEKVRVAQLRLELEQQELEKVRAAQLQLELEQQELEKVRVAQLRLELEQQELEKVRVAQLRLELEQQELEKVRVAAALKLTSWVATTIAYKAFLRLKVVRSSSRLLLQRNVRVLLARLGLQRRQKSALLIQRFVVAVARRSKYRRTVRTFRRMVPLIRMWLGRHRAARKIQRLVRSFRIILRIRKMLKGFRRLLAVRRSKLIKRKVTCPKVSAIAEKIKQSAQRARSDPSMRLGRQTQAALAVLANANGRMISQVLRACQLLELSTQFSRLCCVSFAEASASNVLFALLRSCNRSTPHQELLRISLVILLHVGRHPALAPLVAQSEDCCDVLVDLMQMFRDKKSIFVLAAELLSRLIHASPAVKSICNSPLYRKRLEGILNIIERKIRMEAKVKNVITASSSADALDLTRAEVKVRSITSSGTGTGSSDSSLADQGRPNAVFGLYKARSPGSIEPIFCMQHLLRLLQ